MPQSEPAASATGLEQKTTLRQALTFPPSVPVEKYPYDDWFDGSIWRLKQYEDFFVSPKAMRNAIYQAAKKRNLKVKSHVPRSDNAVYVQVVKP